MKRRQQDVLKVQFCLLKGLLSSIPLLPFVPVFASFVNIVESPLEVTRYFAGLLLLVDVLTFRFLFAEDLSPRKGQAASKNDKWNLPNAGLNMLAGVVVFFLALILFGAPLFESWLESLHLAILLSTVAFTPFCLIFAQPVEEMMKFIQTLETEMSVDKCCLIPGLVAVVGAWCGSVVIPLDWDRPWQQWPTPCCYGAFAGYSLGHLIWMGAILSKLLWRSSPRNFLQKSD